MSLRKQVRAIGRALLQDDAALDKAAIELYNLLTNVAHVVLPLRRTEARILPTGIAISPEDAATCVLDATRTAMFIRGVAAAFSNVKTSGAIGAIEMVYAGAGPLAPLVLPLLVLDALPNVRVTFIDINEASVRSVRRLVELLTDSCGHAFVVGDAAEYRHGRPIDIVVTETMQRALTVEPQVAIATNLAAQLHQRGIMVPERVRIDLCVETDERAHGRYLGTVMELSTAAIREGVSRCPRTLIMPRIDRSVFYSTSIRTYSEYDIKPGESGLTMPLYLWDLSDIEEGERLTFWYETGERPGVKYRRDGHNRLT